VARAGLAPASVTEAAAGLADEIGFGALGMGRLAERLGVKTPSLYKHISSLADLTHRIAVLTATEFADTIRDATQGRAGSDALAAAAHAMRAYVRQHPGRYAALNSAAVTGPDDPLIRARGRLLESFEAVLRGYHLESQQEVHALRMLRSMMHGFANLEGAGGFQLDVEVDDSFAWMIAFIDNGLRTVTTPIHTEPTVDPPRPLP
jgi:AcrR family transcriptional regulator